LKQKIDLKSTQAITFKSSINIGKIEGKDVIFDPNISCEKIFLISEKIANYVINPDGTYMPELSKILIFYFAVQNMTNIKIDKDEEENIDIDFVYRFMTSKIGKKLQKVFNSSSEFKILKSQVQKQIAFKKEVYLKKISSNQTLKNIDKLVNLAYRTINKFSNFIDNQKDFISSENIKTITTAIEKLSENKLTNES